MEQRGGGDKAIVPDGVSSDPARGRRGERRKIWVDDVRCRRRQRRRLKASEQTAGEGGGGGDRQRRALAIAFTETLCRRKWGPSARSPEAASRSPRWPRLVVTGMQKTSAATPRGRKKTTGNCVRTSRFISPLAQFVNPCPPLRVPE